MVGNDFKALIFKELGDIRMEMAENARATKLRKTDDTESTNSGTSSLLSHRSSTSDAENQSIFATPLAELPSEIRALLEKAVALVAEGVVAQHLPAVLRSPPEALRTRHAAADMR